jgi:hypothetical protein
LYVIIQIPEDIGIILHTLISVLFMNMISLLKSLINPFLILSIISVNRFPGEQVVTLDKVGRILPVAASCSLADVQTRINEAADGDTVLIPAGNCTWTSGIATSKGIIIKGAGATSTVITGGGFDMATPNGKSFRITGIGWRGDTGISVTGTSKSWRIDNSAWTNASGRVQDRVIWIEPDCDYTTGLIDHNVFKDTQATVNIHVRSGCVGGNREWIRNSPAGSADNNVFVENNTFDNASWTGNVVNDCEGGGSMVWRYNTIKNLYIQTHDAIIGGLRGCRSMEVYENNWTVTNNCFVPIALRGGRQIVFNNTLTGAAANSCSLFIAYATYRSYQTGGQAWNICSATSGSFCGSASKEPIACTSDAQCGGVAGSCIKTDGTSTSPSGFPCRDQLGTSGNNPQTIVPSLYWNNTKNGVYQAPGLQSSSNNPAYTTAGVAYCHGTTKPASCNGVTTTYASYAYPHPFRANCMTNPLICDAGSIGAGPVAPSDLRLQ